MSVTLPAGWQFFGSANNGNSVTFVLPGHTAETPRLAIFKRVIPTYNNGVWSKPSYTAKVSFGLLDADGAPVRPLLEVGTDGIRWPMGAASFGTTFDAAHAAFESIISADGFAEMVKSQAFPRAASA